MKNKFLFGALLSGAVLVSCNVKDGLETGVEYAPQSPVFAVSMDDAATRAEMVSNGNKLVFGDGDLMTLYHGGSQSYENAIYEGAGDGESLTFKTKAMVKPGTAILVYPADLTFANLGKSALEIGLSMDQDDETVESTPYISEFLDVQAVDSKTKGAQAGYDKPYEIKMKRLASTLDVTLVNDGEIELPAGVSPLQVTSVTIDNGESKNIFVEKVALAEGSAIANGIKDFDKSFPLWSKISTITTPDATASALKTSALKDDVATFTMLPFADAAAFDKDVAIIVATNYGTVTIKNGEVNKTTGANAVLGKKNSTTGKVDYNNIEHYLNEWAKNSWRENATEKSVFYKSMNGIHGALSLLVDYTTLDMNGTHIKTSEQLIDVLAVYDYLADKAESEEDFNTEVEFFLDGDEDGAFYMDADALAAYTAHIGKKSDITFTPCPDKGEECSIVVLTGGDTVPVALDFSTPVEVYLEGAWTLAGEHAFNGVSGFYVPEDSTLTLNGTVEDATTKAITDAYTVTALTDGIYVDGTAVVTAGKTVTLKKGYDVENHGTVEIPAASALLMNNATFTNSYDVFTGDAAKNKTGYQLLASEGQVNVSGRLAATANGKIENYGVVTMTSADAYIYLTNNAVAGSKYSTAFTAASNVIGSVVLFDATGNENVNIAGEQGFIKLKLEQATVTDKDLGSIANYAILAGAVETYDAQSVGEDETVQNKIKYLEVNSTKQVKIVGKYASGTKNNFAGLWVHEGSNVNIPTGSQVTVVNAYLQGYVYCAGTWYDGVKYETYFGEGSEDHYAYTGPVTK